VNANHLETELPESDLLDRSGAPKARVESHIVRLIKGARNSPWVLGVFDADGNVRHFALSGEVLNRRRALGILCAVPLPDATGTVTLRVTGENGKLSSVLGASTMLDHGRALVFAVSRPPGISDKAWSRVAYSLPGAMRRMVTVVQSVMREPLHRTKPIVEPTGEDSGFVLLTKDFKVAFHWHPVENVSTEIAKLIAPQDERLPTLLERAVRRLTASWDFARLETCTAGVVVPIPGLRLRVVPMVGDGIFIGVSLESQSRDPIDQSEPGFRISPREREVLHALLDGHSVREIAARLDLAESTVQDHIARLIVKTNSHNRIEMAAAFLGWRRHRTGSVKGDATRRFAESAYGYP